MIVFSTKLDAKKVADLVAYWQMKGMMTGTRSTFIRAIVEWVWDSLYKQELLPKRHLTMQDALHTLSQAGLHVAQSDVNRKVVLDELEEDSKKLSHLQALHEELSKQHPVTNDSNKPPDIPNGDIPEEDDFDPSQLDWGSKL